MIGGEGGIRTPGTVTRTSHFECDAIDQLCHLSAAEGSLAGTMRYANPFHCTAEYPNSQNSLLVPGQAVNLIVRGLFRCGSWPMANYFLTVQGMDGGSFNEIHPGSFDVNAFKFDVSNLFATTTGSGAGIGKAVFAPLSVNIEAGAHLNGLMNAAATGKHISLLRLQGENNNGQTVYDLRMAEVVVTKVTDSDGVDKLQFSYSRVSLTTTDVNADGSLGTSQTFVFDLKTNAVSKLKVVSALTTPIPAAVAGNIGGSVNEDHYLLTVPGMNGHTTDSHHVGDFDVQSFNIGVSRLVSSVSGNAQGKPAFTPLTVNFDDGIPLNGLLKAAATGKHLSQIKLHGLTTDNQLVYDLKLTDVTVARVTDTNTIDSVKFNYSGITLTTHKLNFDGSLAPAQTFTFNLKTNSPTKISPAKQVDHTQFDFTSFQSHDPDGPVHHHSAPPDHAQLVDMPSLHFGFDHGLLS
jgi:type VI protein secretion system component Hcp